MGITTSSSLVDKSLFGNALIIFPGENKNYLSCVRFPGKTAFLKKQCDTVMKHYIKHRLLFLLLFFLSLYSSAQLRSVALKDMYLDTLYLYEPLGDIFLNSRQGDMPSELLTMAFNETIKNELSRQMYPCVIRYLSLESHDDSSWAMYFFKNLSRFELLSNRQFNELSLEDEVVALLRNKPGRYFGLLFINGYAQRHYPEKLIGGLALFVATLMLTYGEYYYLYMPKEPFAEVTLIVVDREKKRYLYYCNHKIIRDPLNPSTSQHLSKVLTKDLSPARK